MDQPAVAAGLEVEVVQARPKDEEPVKDEQIARLQRNVGELVLDMEALARLPLAVSVGDLRMGSGRYPD